MPCSDSFHTGQGYAVTWAKLAANIPILMIKNISDPRLALKATPPKASPSLLYRDRLGLNRGSQTDRFVIALQAPAGYGKTSLLLQWRREALKAGAIVAWLTLDEHDDAASVVQGLDVALSIGTGAGKFDSSRPSSNRQYDNELEDLTVWLAEVANLAMDVVLVLDDGHNLPEATVESSLMYLLLNAPANLKIIIAYHRPIPLRFGELLASSHFLLLEADNLRFTLEETCQVLTTRFGNDIDQESCERLHGLTKGWPLGVQLTVSTILKSGNLRSAITEFSPRTGDMQRYFMEYLVDRLPPDAAEFLTEISFLNRVHPELCQWLTGSGEMLAYLREMTPIFQGAESGNWVRMLPIARDFLNDRFENLPQEHQIELHTRAASWLAEHEMLEEAAYHALLAGNETYAFDLIERCLYDIMSMGRMACVLEWIKILPKKEVERRPQIRLVAGWALAQSEKHAAAVELVGSLIEDPAAESAERFEAAKICATAAFFADDIDRLLLLISQWREPLQYQTQSQRIGHTNIQAVGALLGGSPENANYLLGQFSDSARSKQLNYISGWSDWISGFAYLWEGHVARAEEVLRASLWRAEETAGRRSPIAGMLSATLAAVLWERGLPDEAGKLLVGRLDVLERHAPPDAIIHGYVTSARVAVESGHHDRAHHLLEHLRAIGDTRDLPRLCVASLAEEVRMLALRNQETACTTRLVRLEQANQAATPRWGMLSIIIRPQIGLARVYAAIARHDWDAVSPELAIIDPLLKKTERVREAIQVLLLQALAGKQRGDDVAAMLDEATSLAETFGLRRILIDTHPELEKICHPEKREQNTEANPRLAPQVAVAPSKAQPRVAATALLTPKETEILQLLAGNLSNKQIASALGVGDQTVKWHLKNMFDKLQAGNRKHLLGRARMLGILV